MYLQPLSDAHDAQSVRLHSVCSSSSVCSTAKRASVRCLRATTGPSQGSTATQLQALWTSPTCLSPPLSTGLSSCGAPRLEQFYKTSGLFDLAAKTCVLGKMSPRCVFCASTWFHIIPLLFILNCTIVQTRSVSCYVDVRLFNPNKSFVPSDLASIRVSTATTAPAMELSQC